MPVYRNRVQVYGPEIASLFAAGGDVYDEARGIARKTERRAIALAPVGGPRIDGQRDKIKTSHSINLVRSGIYGTRGYVVNSARHAHWVHEGTAGPILPKRSKLLGPLPFAARGRYGGGMKRKYVPSVRGQASQPWLRRAAETVLLPYGVVGIYSFRG